MPSFYGAASSVSKFAPDRFRATIMNGRGLSSASRFEVSLPSIGGMQKVGGGSINDKSTSDDRNLLCVAANIPGSQISGVQRPYSIEPRQYANGYTNSDCTMTFYLTNTYIMRDYFERWMQCIVDRGEKNNMNTANMAAFYRSGSGQSYQKDIKIVQYSRDARKSYSVKLIDAYPMNVSQIELNSQLQTQASEFTVTWGYRMFWTDANMNAAVQG